MRIILISERWESVADEGMLVYLDRLARHLAEENELLILHRSGEVDSNSPAHRVEMGRGLLSKQLIDEVTRFAPQLIIYCPTACATLGALYRHRRLQRRFGVPCALLSLQSRSYPAWVRHWVLPQLRPWRLIVLSERAAREYRELNFDVLQSRAGVDLEKFRPADAQERAALRSKLALPEDRRMALHVGHLAQFRNLEDLEELTKSPDLAMVMVASTANAADEQLAARLESAGVVVRHEFIPRIEDYYRAADLYIFPVQHRSGAIEFPLSVLEAMACDLPVVTTPFGALPEHFTEGSGLCFLSDEAPLVEAASAILEQPVANRQRVESFSWDVVMGALIVQLREAMGR